MTDPPVPVHRPPRWDEVDAARRLAPTAFADVRWLAEVDSTNRWLLEAARAGTASSGTVVAADVQTAGRGRRGRSWQAAPGSAVLMSVLLPVTDPDDVTRAGSAVGLAALDALSSLGVAAGLKWPNDLVAASGPHVDGKLAGILGEAVLEGGAPRAVVVGIGCNVAAGALPAELTATATTVEALAGRPVDRIELLVAMLEALDRRWRSPRPELVAAHRAACTTVGRAVRVERPGGAVTGTAVDVLADGRLRVRADDGRVHDLAAGDVVHLRPTDGSPPGAGPAEYS